jgi:hypothetical protein
MDLSKSIPNGSWSPLSPPPLSVSGARDGYVSWFHDLGNGEAEDEGKEWSPQWDSFPNEGIVGLSVPSQCRWELGNDLPTGDESDSISQRVEWERQGSVSPLRWGYLWFEREWSWDETDELRYRLKLRRREGSIESLWESIHWVEKRVSCKRERVARWGRGVLRNDEEIFVERIERSSLLLQDRVKFVVDIFFTTMS